jgi:hypothetical protein
LLLSAYVGTLTPRATLWLLPLLLLLLLHIRSQALPLLQAMLPAAEALLLQLPSNFFEPAAAQLGSLDGGQADVLREVNAALAEEYRVRRRMLIERVKVSLR